jgi:hypothetical protein
MTIWKCYGRGLRAAAARPRVILLLWLWNLALAGLAASVLAPPLAAYFGDSLSLDKLMATFDLNTLFEFLAGRSQAVGEVVRMLVVVILAYVVSWPFFQGGVLNSLVAMKRRERQAGVFFEGGGRYYGRFFRLEVFSLVLWIPAALLFLAVGFFLGLAAADPDAEYLRFVLLLVRFGLAVLVYNFVRMILDYARIRLVLTDGRRVGEALLAATRFVFGRPGRTFILFYLFALTALPFLLGYAGLRISYPQTTAGAVAVVFLVSQASIFVRGFVRVAFQAGQMEFFKSFEPAQDPGRERDQGLEKVEGGVDRDPQEAEGKEEEPDEREKEQGEQGQRPADDQENEPEEEFRHVR